jgi:hypothetical protein
VAQHEHTRCRRIVFVGTEGAAEQWLRAERIEECRRDGAHRNANRFGAANPQRARPINRADKRDAFERVGTLADVEVVAERHLTDGMVARDVARPQHDDACWLVEAEWAQQHRLDDAEHRGAGADADSEHHHGGDRQPSLLQQGANGVFEVEGHVSTPRVYGIAA